MSYSTVLQELSLSKVLVAAWVFTVSVFFLYSLSYPVLEKSKIDAVSQQAYSNGYATATNQALSSLSGNVLQNGYNNGYGAAVVQLAQSLTAQYQGGCKEAVPVTIGSGSIGIMSIECLQKILPSTATGQSAPSQTPGAPAR